MRSKYIFPAALVVSLFAIQCKDENQNMAAAEDAIGKFAEKNYHYGEVLDIPKDIKENYKEIKLDFGDHISSTMTVTPKDFTLGVNPVTFILTGSSGKEERIDANITILSKTPAKQIQYLVVKEYPHNPQNFVQGFQYRDGKILESSGQNGASHIEYYTLGSTNSLVKTVQNADVFAEGASEVQDKVFQLTWQNKIGYIYEKNTLKPQGEFAYPNQIAEGWGLTFDGKNMIVSDGTKFLYFLDPKNPQKITKKIGVASDTAGFEKLNELEYVDGSIYANVWRTNTILKISSEDGSVLGFIDLSALGAKNQKGDDDVLNGIAFKDGNLLITGKYWPTIYEISLK